METRGKPSYSSATNVLLTAQEGRESGSDIGPATVKFGRKFAIVKADLLKAGRWIQQNLMHTWLKNTKMHVFHS